MKLKRRGEILSEAAQIFCENGYRGTNVRDLGQRLGVEAASLYNYFESKEDILKTICFNMLDQFEAGRQEVLIMGGTPEEMFRHAVATHIGMLKRNLYSSTVYLQDWRYLYNPEDYARFKAHKDGYEAYFLAIMEACNKTGFLKIKNVKHDFNFVFSAMNWVVQWDRIEDEFENEVKTTVDIITDLILGGLK